MILTLQSQKESTRNQCLKHLRTNTDQEESDEEEEEEEKEYPLGATTRSATDQRLRDQRHSSPLWSSTREKPSLLELELEARRKQKPSGKAEVVMLALAF